MEVVQMPHKFIVVEGNIGAGKTTLVERLGMQLNGRVILEEFKDNPFLPKFYHEPERFAFPLELSFLAARYRQLKNDLDMGDLFHALTISDYHFMKSLIFARFTLPEDEYKLYRQVFDIIYSMIPIPDLYVFLYRPIDVLLSNIAKRGREYEKSIDRDYLNNVQDSYFRFFREHPEIPVVILDLGGNDFLTNDGVYKKILHQISKKHPSGVTRLSVVD